MTHTPGPWAIGIYTDNDGARSIMSNDPTDTSERRRVAMVDSFAKVKRKDLWNAECPERDSNACLIAAAPDLLEALKRIQFGACDGISAVCPECAFSEKHLASCSVGQAIAKAEGKP